MLTTIEPHVSAAFELRELWAFRELFFSLVTRDIKVRYRQTLVGVGWAVLQPLLIMLVLTAVFGGSARIPSDGVPYPLFAYAGLLAWTFFANAVFTSSNSLVGNAPLITKIYFPRLLVPIAAVAARLVDFAIAFVLLAGLMVWYRASFTSQLWAMPVLVLLATVLALACGVWLSALNVKYRDVNVALPHVLQLVMFATPVFYSSALLPARWRFMATLNPLAALLDGFRAAVFGTRFDWAALSGCAAFAAVLLATAVVAFRRMEEHFPDLV
jgi:lipopolysaccharide transport system permease protein